MPFGSLVTTHPEVLSAMAAQNAAAVDPISAVSYAATVAANAASAG